MTYYGALTIGRLTLTEPFEAKDSGGARELSLSGQESWPPLPSANIVRYRGEQLMAMEGQIVPVQFASKTDRNGFYLVQKPSVDYEHYDNNVSTANWSVTLTRLGNESETIFESRLVGGTRTSYYGLAYERWHAPSVGVLGYYAGPDIPGSMIRTGSEGPLTLYRYLAPNSSPRWGAQPANYMRGASRVLVGGLVRSGTTCDNTVDNWSLENTLIKIGPTGFPGTFSISRYASGVYQNTYTDSYGTGAYTTPQNWTVNVAGFACTAPIAFTIIKNSPEESIIRLTFQIATGYCTVDISLRRGSRFVSVFAQGQSASAITFLPSAPIASTDSSFGYIFTTTNNAQGDRFVSGSSVRVNVNTSLGSIENAIPALSFGCFLGVEVGGSNATVGNNALVLAQQYLGQASEVVKAVAR